MRQPNGDDEAGGHTARPYVAWGRSAWRAYQLASLPGRSCLAIIDSFAPTGRDAVTGVEVIRPGDLARFSSEEVDVIIFADAVRFGDEIRRQIMGIGSYEVFIHGCLTALPAPLECSTRKLFIRHRVDATLDEKVDSAVLIIPRLTNGGAERQIVLLAVGLRAAGYDVRLVTFFQDAGEISDLRAILAEHGVARVAISHPDDPARPLEIPAAQAGLYDDLRAFLPPLTAALAVNVAMFLQAERPSLLVSYLDCANMVAGIAGVVAGVRRIVLSGRNLAPTEYAEHPAYLARVAVMCPVYRALSSFAEVRLTANSAAGAASYERWLGGVRVVPVPNAVWLQTSEGLRETLRASLGVGSGALLIAGVMRLTAQKQPLRFVDVVAGLVRRGRNVKAVLVGDGELRSAVEERVLELGLEGRLTLVGARPMASNYIQAADLLILTSEYEGMPNVLLEALAAGTPFIATEVGGVRDAIPPETHHVLVPFGEWEAFLERCDDALQRGRLDPSLVLGWVKDHDPRTLAERTEGLFDQAPVRV
jgi:glycosyltransferase involved in cell wall biosynthesis